METFWIISNTSEDGRVTFEIRKCQFVKNIEIKF